MGKTTLILCLIAGVAGFYAFRYELDKKRREIEEARVLLTNAEDSVRNKEGQLTPKKQEVADIQAKIELHTDLTNSAESLKSTIPALERARKAVQDEFVEVVQNVRAASSGIAWPDVTLANGQVLQSVTIQKVGESDVSFAHSRGISRVNADDLPPDLKERFRFGLPPMVQAPAASGLVVGPPASQPASAAPSTAPTPTPPPPPARPLDTAKISQMENTVRELEKKMAEYARSSDVYQRQVQDFRKKDDEARQSGMRPRHTQQVIQLDGALRDLSRRMAELNTQIGDLKTKIENEKAGTI